MDGKAELRLYVDSKAIAPKLDDEEEEKKGIKENMEAQKRKANVMDEDDE